MPPLQDQQPPAQNPRPDYSPESRRRAAVDHTIRFAGLGKHLNRTSRLFQIIRRVIVGCIDDGLIHAGNLAYMSVLAIFPFFITAAAIFSAIGEEAERAATISAIVSTLPPIVAEVIEPAARSVIEARKGWLLWVGGAFGLWTVGSLIETIRDILRRAYGTPPARAFWINRLFSTGIIVAAVFLLLLSLIAQVAIGTAQEIIGAYYPDLDAALQQLAWSRIISALGLFFSIFMLFIALTPAAYRFKRYPKWPGAALVTLWWLIVTLALPPLLRSLFVYDMTYGSLAGMMIALFFFWLVGLGMVAGAELNAALAETPEEEREKMDRNENYADNAIGELKKEARE